MRVKALVWTCALALAAGVRAGAHEIGTTRVLVSLGDDRRYDIEIATDATALLEKLTTAGSTADRAVDPAVGASRVADRLRELDDVFRRRVAVTVDGRAVRPSIAYAVSPPRDFGAMSATIHLTGVAPPDAQKLEWTYGWTFASYAQTVRRAGSGDARTTWLEGGDSSTLVLSPVEARAVRADTQGSLYVVMRYVALGFTHILPLGIDHVLFVLGLFLLADRPRPLLLQVSAFTIAHSITLGLSMYHLIAVRASVVEPLIAISIAYVAIENLFTTTLRRSRVAVVFAFGLLHGLGFAGALGELGLPRAEFLTALVGFNAGVEAGQLAVIAGAFLAVGWRWRDSVKYRHAIVVPASAAIACVAVYWTVVRLM